MDLHKWLFLPYGLGCLLVREPNQLSTSFSEQAHYWSHDSRVDFMYLGPEGAPSWKSLGLWLALRHLGREGYERLLMGNLEVARYLAGRVRETDGLELFADPVLPVCWFRATPPHGDDIDDYNAALQSELIRRGEVHLTVCHPNGEAYLRVAVNNHTTRPEHADVLIDAVLEARATLDQTGGPRSWS
ncbi:pyridoxal-dependent decarboxylase [Amycolatopsis decaplanina]|uniref:Pyridoxal-dependent decarboxylase n=1 Tax=Amycolatopsis decaplanina DSM 44594 TaxID=1284240 RepID=M2Z2A4_9PSEU|nr:pyridoxal-dependent decarboxylase [Amycolatopsis decaplanina]EME55013.1 pyridoxal-dependent decarboxylase [Amycolatopsis decaplanina DSM 44594]